MVLPFAIAFSVLHIIAKPEKLGLYLERFSLKMPDEKQKVEKRIWLHAVSLGEVLSCEPLIRLLIRRNVEVCLSTGTETGFQTAEKWFPETTCFYLPFDFQFATVRFLKRINPDAVLLCELEIWPSFVWSVHERGIPLYLVSGRMVQKDFLRYRRFKWFFSPVFSLFSALYMQNETYTARMRKLCSHSRVKTLGSFKFDTCSEFRHSADIEDLMPTGFNLTAVSTHSGDEALIVEAFLALRIEFPELRLVLVPRHSSRSKEIGRLLGTKALPFTLRSEESPCRTPVFVVDTIGEMPGVYEKSGLVVIGGSFSKKVGGHNIIEPAAYGKCILCGDHMENFEDIHSLFKREGAMASTTRERLLEDLRALISNPRKTVEIGEKALEVVKKNRGASERVCNRILSDLANRNTEPINR